MQEPLVAVPPIEPVGLDGAAGPAATRLVDAALACIARVGVSKSTLDDVAREAGVSRATLYRYFPGKPALLGAVVAREAATLSAALDHAAASATTLSDAVVAMVLEAQRWLTAHDALNFVLLAEPELLLPHLAFDGADRVLDAGARVVAPALARFLDSDDAARAAEWLARILLSYLCSPTDTVELSDPNSVRALVDDFVVPGLTTVSSQGVTP
ncbi:MAG TPA: TetR/AcrR family transcriptional regulator [Acidimicrobiia bacterium]|nr:TetR/AcrR family transcriptional regulator [Acidimicrobiia bacterium]